MVPYERIGRKDDYPPLHKGSQIDLHPSLPKRNVRLTVFALGQQQSCLPKALESLSPPPFPPTQTLLKLVTK
jgi:hypothetical protein